ncbi:cathepsin F-like [Colias croceus]|uniref:cathepsin F-like n=1 Tax=Colias crocea TaxID=72248 RepID=UPI001E27C3AC|nr:cathepsin F-like [Colias croceus]
MTSEKPCYNVADAPALFEKFIKDNNRVYAGDNDLKIHYEAFVKNLEKINAMNAQGSTQGSAVYDINKFADYTEEEWKNMFGFRKS